MHQKLRAVFALVDTLKVCGIPSIVAGGCGRDMAHGITPKDFDIIIPMGIELDDVLRALIAHNAEIGKFFPMYDKADGDRIQWVQKAMVQVDPDVMFSDWVDIDIISYAIDYPQAAVEWFDFNLNQFVIYREWVEDGPLYAAKFMGTDHPKDGLVKVRDDMSAKREEYIKAKWETLYGKNGQ